MKKFILIFIISLLTSKVCGQSFGPFCNSDELLQKFLQLHPNYLDTISNFPSLNAQYKGSVAAEEDFTIFIPVVFHIVYNNNFPAINITDAQIATQMFALNYAFSNSNSHALGVNTKIQFCLAKRDPNGNTSTGITRFSAGQNDYVIRSTNSDESTIRSIDYWPSNKYLNIWVCDLKEEVFDLMTQTNVIGDLKGRSTFPFTLGHNDGILLNYKYCGNNYGTANITNFNHGKILVHEAGHWLGLFHTFQDSYPMPPGACGNCTGGSSAGDQMPDTPPQRGESLLKDPYWLTAVDLTKRYTCDLNCTSASPLISAENYMDYNYTQYMNYFSQNQKERMRFNLITYRNHFYYYSKNNPSILPIECNESFTYQGENGNGVTGSCEHKKYPDEWFRMNGSENPLIELCEGVDPIVNRFNPTTGTCLKHVCHYVRKDCGSSDNFACTGFCSTSILGRCTWACDQVGACTCCDYRQSYFFSIYYNCDENFNCANEILSGNWITYKCYGENVPQNFNVASILGFNMASQSRYKIKFAMHDENGVWRQGVKLLRYIPANVNISNNLANPNNILMNVKAVNDINISSSVGPDISFVAGNQISLLPGTIIAGVNSFNIDNVTCSSSQFRLVNNVSPTKQDSIENMLSGSPTNSQNTLDEMNGYNILVNEMKAKELALRKTEANFIIVESPSADGLFSIETRADGVGVMSVYDCNGKLIVVSNKDSKSIVLDLSQFENGIYLLKLDTGENQYSRKLIKG